MVRAYETDKPAIPGVSPKYLVEIVADKEAKRTVVLPRSSRRVASQRFDMWER